MDSLLREPRCTVNGIVPIDCSVLVSAHQSADTFSATFSLDDPNGQDASHWADTAPISVTVKATNDASSGGYVTMFQGNVDTVEIDFINRTAHVSGRDKTSGPIDSKTNEKWLNKKSQDIIEDLAKRSGLTVDFQGKARDRSGLKYNQDYSRISESDSHWNMIVKMAKQMGCVARVNGDTLTIAPFDKSDGGTYTINYQPPSNGQPEQANVLGLICGRDLNLAKTVRVNHKSWQHKQGEAIESEFEAEGKGGTLEHTYKAPNLTKQQQDDISEASVNEKISHERTVSVHAPGDVNISPDMSLVLSGTGTGFDQSYIISDIEHHWSFDGGYRMSISVRNKDSKRSSATQKK